MFRMIAATFVVLAPALAWAGSTNTGAGGKTPPNVRAQADQYARHVLNLIAYVESRYVRPVERASLVEAAIVGLYEAVREPLPAGLKNDLARARSAKEFEHILSSSRAQLGDREELRDFRALLISMKSLPRALDPYCGVPTNNELRRSMNSETNVGLGIEFDLPAETVPNPFDVEGMPVSRSVPNGPFRIANIIPGSPAQRGGLRPGDVVTHVGGQATTGDQGPLLMRRLMNNDGRSVELSVTVKRPGRAEPLTLPMTPGPFVPEFIFGARRHTDNSWSYLLDSTAKIGYIRIGFIDNAAPPQLEAALQDAMASGVKGIILDLRDCPGGYVDPAVEIASMFVKSGTIATVRDRGSQEQQYQATGRSFAFDKIKLIALVNANTMGGGEMIAAALQDHGLAKICGQRTFGKGSVQRTQTVTEVGFSFKITTGLFTRPNGKNLQRFPDSKPDDDWGVRPDAGYELPLPPDLHQQLKEWNTHAILRPGNSREPLPLDDPENDPLKQFALREIKKLIK